MIESFANGVPWPFMGQVLNSNTQTTSRGYLSSYTGLYSQGNCWRCLAASLENREIAEQERTLSNDMSYVFLLSHICILIHAYVFSMLYNLILTIIYIYMYIVSLFRVWLVRSPWLHHFGPFTMWSPSSHRIKTQWKFVWLHPKKGKTLPVPVSTVTTPIRVSRRRKMELRTTLASHALVELGKDSAWTVWRFLLLRWRDDFKQLAWYRGHVVWFLGQISKGWGRINRTPNPNYSLCYMATRAVGAASAQYSL